MADCDATVGRYKRGVELGRGGMGVVYRGFDPKIRRDVAIKVIQLDQSANSEQKAELKSRFAIEAAAAGQLSHTNIVTVYDFGEQGDAQYLILELIEGSSLEVTLRRRQLQDSRMTVSVLSQVAAALDHAHAFHVVHRDVKPANILMGPGGTVKITDFGIARMSSQTVTRTGCVVGTAAYMAPEQIRSGNVDGKADQFSLAVIAYQMLSGTMPFTADQQAALWDKILHEEPPNLCDLIPSCPRRASDVLKRGLAKDPDQRYTTCAAFIKDLSEALEEEKPTVPKSPLMRAPNQGSSSPVGDRKVPAWRARWAIVFGAAASAAVILLMALGVLNRPEPRPTHVADLSAVTSGAPAAAPPLHRAEMTSSPAAAPPVGNARNGRSDAPAEIPGRRTVEVVAPPVTASVPATASAQSVAPVVAQISAQPKSIQRGQSSTLYWQVYGAATNVSIDQTIGAVETNGDRRVFPSENTTYTLTATGPGGTAAVSASVSVTAPLRRPESPPGDHAAGKTPDSPGPVPSPVVDSEPHMGDSKINPRDGLKYVWIPAGTFMLGCSRGDRDCLADEKPALEVTITRGFWLGQTDVTQTAYRRVIGSSPSHFKGDNLPVESVNESEARSYCQAIGGRLPTSAEWEYAARAGSTAARYGNLDDIAWYYGNSGGKTHEVGQKQPNRFGLYDMLGNVSQWVGSQGSAGHRGGSWVDGPRDARVSNSLWVTRLGSDFNFNAGVRCVWE